MTRNPLGRTTAYPQEYAPDVLYPVARRDAREAMGLRGPLPFAGEDVWNAWELTWLDASGRPVVAAATIRVPADTTHIVESKSLKLYLNSFAMTRYPDAAAVAETLRADLGRVAGGPVAVEIATARQVANAGIGEPGGACIDDEPAEFTAAEVTPSLLAVDGDVAVSETLHSHLLRSNCPVTGQPDMGSVLIRYRGPRIDRAGLLAYVVSYRSHCAFHEACVERMFVDIRQRCGTEQLTVYARYCRRGGIDINPFRSDFEARADNVRLWRQ